MAKYEHLKLLKESQGDKIHRWNTWRNSNPNINPDLRGADLREIDLGGADLTEADLTEAVLFKTNLTGAQLWGADLRDAYLVDANLTGVELWGSQLMRADLRRANLTDADLSDAWLADANLTEANLTGADLTEANLMGANLNEADLTRANLTSAYLAFATLVKTVLKNSHIAGTWIYGISAWDVDLEGATQLDLVITPPGEIEITVDNLKVAQFVYLLLNNAEIRDVIDTIAKKVVLILGRFTPERKAILDAVRNELRKHNYSPIVFDFEKPGSRDFTETVRTLAHLARFIIADLTEPSSIPLELQAIVPDLMIPVQPLLLEAKREDGQAMGEFAMFVDLRRKYSWVLPTCFYQDQAHLLALLPDNVIKPAEELAKSYYTGNREPK